MTGHDIATIADALGKGALILALALGVSGVILRASAAVFLGAS